MIVTKLLTLIDILYIFISLILPLLKLSGMLFPIFLVFLTSLYFLSTDFSNFCPLKNWDGTLLLFPPLKPPGPTY